jgi:hypothetical protein
MTGCLLGVSLWVKLPGILAAPALGFVFPRWRDRLAFGASLLVTGALTYVPLLVIDPDIVFRRVLSYQGLVILTSAGVRIWGLQNFLYLTGALPGAWQQQNFNGHPQCAVLFFAVASLVFLWRAVRDESRWLLGLGLRVAPRFR